MMEDKVQIKAYVPKSLDKAFRALIAQKYGEFRKGYLSWEITQALHAWIAEHNLQQQLNKNRSNPGPRVKKVAEQVKQYLMDHFGYKIIYTVPVKHIVTAIANVRGSDDRTIRKWLKLFAQQKIIKYISPMVVEFLA